MEQNFGGGNSWRIPPKFYHVKIIIFTRSAIMSMKIFVSMSVHQNINFEVLLSHQAETRFSYLIPTVNVATRMPSSAVLLANPKVTVGVSS